jgi:hypothetical protein
MIPRGARNSGEENAMNDRRFAWYNALMSTTIGSGLTLKDSVPWLQDDAQRHARILEVAEINSVIEGLPPFTAATRQHFASQLAAMAAGQTPAPLGSIAPAANSSS